MVSIAKTILLLTARFPLRKVWSLQFLKSCIIVAADSSLLKVKSWSIHSYIIDWKWLHIQDGPFGNRCWSYLSCQNHHLQTTSSYAQRHQMQPDVIHRWRQEEFFHQKWAQDMMLSRTIFVQKNIKMQFIGRYNGMCRSVNNSNSRRKSSQVIKRITTGSRLLV